MAIPPVAPMMDEEMAEGEGSGVMIDCAAMDCSHNQGGKCGALAIKVGAGAKCETYDPTGGAPSEAPGKLPRPPMPPAPPMM